MIGLVIALVPLILKILDIVMDGIGASKEEKRQLAELAKTLRAKGIKNAKSRFEAEDQIAEIDQKWEELNAKK